ncbi:DUF2334 domain-containing protein [Methanocaldococcus sp.]
MKRLLYLASLIIIFMIFIHGVFKINNSSYGCDNHILKNSTEKPIIRKPMIFIHDVSPIYLNDLKDIIKIINKYGYQNRTYLFVIVNHANKYNIEKYPKFVKYLHYLEKEGYHIEYHGYNHIGYEFNCSKTVAEEKLNKSFKILENCGFDIKKIKYFIPPRYKISKAAEEVFLNRNITIILDKYMLKKENNSIKKIVINNKEYTWYLPKNCVKSVELLAKIDYISSKHQFCLSIHPKAVNYGGGLEFLNYFLNMTKQLKSQDQS